MIFFIHLPFSHPKGSTDGMRNICLVGECAGEVALEKPDACNWDISECNIWPCAQAIMTNPIYRNKSHWISALRLTDVLHGEYQACSDIIRRPPAFY